MSILVVYASAVSTERTRSSHIVNSVVNALVWVLQVIRLKSTSRFLVSTSIVVVDLEQHVWLSCLRVRVGLVNRATVPVLEAVGTSTAAHTAIDHVLVDTVAFLALNCVLLHWSVETAQLESGTLRDEVLGCDVRLGEQQCARVLTDANLADDAVLFNALRNEHALSKDIVADQLRANDTGHNLSSVDTASHVKVLGALVVRRLLQLLDDIHHFQASLNDPVGFVNDNTADTLHLVNLSIVAHDDVAVSERVHLVDFVVLAQLVEAREDLLQ